MTHSSPSAHTGDGVTVSVCLSASSSWETNSSLWQEEMLQFASSTYCPTKTGCWSAVSLDVYIKVLEKGIHGSPNLQKSYLVFKRIYIHFKERRNYLHVFWSKRSEKTEESQQVEWGLLFFIFLCPYTPYPMHSDSAGLLIPMPWSAIVGLCRRSC